MYVCMYVCMASVRILVLDVVLYDGEVLLPRRL